MDVDFTNTRTTSVDDLTDQREDISAAGGFRLMASRTAVVQDGYYWRPIDEKTPRGAKLQLINRQAGVAAYGVLGTHTSHWTHWAPLPVWPKD